MSYEVFKCPNCQQFISNQQSICRFCSFPLSDEVKTQAIKSEAEETRKYRFNLHKKILYIGIGIFAVGLILVAGSFMTIFVKGEGTYFPGSPIIVLFGLGQMLIGALGMVKERKKN